MLTVERVRELVQLYDEGWELPALAARYGVTTMTVSRVVTGKSWRHVTGGVNISRLGELTEYRRAYIGARLEQGCRNYSIIGLELGITRHAVWKLVNRETQDGPQGT